MAGCHVPLGRLCPAHWCLAERVRPETTLCKGWAAPTLPICTDGPSSRRALHSQWRMHQRACFKNFPRGLRALSCSLLEPFSGTQTGKQREECCDQGSGFSQNSKPLTPIHSSGNFSKMLQAACGFLSPLVALRGLTQPWGLGEKPDLGSNPAAPSGVVTLYMIIIIIIINQTPLVWSIINNNLNPKKRKPLSPGPASPGHSEVHFLFPALL